MPTQTPLAVDSGSGPGATKATTKRLPDQQERTGEFIVLTRIAHAPEGVVIAEFPCTDAARTWYESPA
ncbi:DUF1330 domain-containing protein [Caballeronia sp. GAFFF1]|uniref:DUF1330 domain-containing protein n=1 Tax=Caballeronia sp. GAFFF1 TaxID=2921779 RepID=UPI0020284315|nr:DUF1330 domain-containing protein [Caballeronia sp. GAFFF1]